MIISIKGTVKSYRDYNEFINEEGDISKLIFESEEKEQSSEKNKDNNDDELQVEVISKYIFLYNIMPNLYE